MTILHEYAFAALVLTSGLRHQSFAAISRIVSAWRHVVDSQDKKIAEFRKTIRQSEKRYNFIKSTAWGK